MARLPGPWPGSSQSTGALLLSKAPNSCTVFWRDAQTAGNLGMQRIIAFTITIAVQQCSIDVQNETVVRKKNMERETELEPATSSLVLLLMIRGC